MFVDISSATIAYEALNGEVVSSIAQVLYLSFVQDIPQSIKRNNWKLCNSLPEGLQVVNHFVSEEEEDNIINGLDWNEGKENVLKNRQVRHFGKEFIYGKNEIEKDTGEGQTIPFPLTWTPILQRTIDQGFQNRWPDQCTVNRYVPGSGIPQHTDNHNCCDDTIVALSLGSDIIMNFNDLENQAQSVSVLLPQRSLMVMTGRSRYAFTHGITSRKSDIYLDTTNKLLCRPRRERISLTFRKSISEACVCSFPKTCPNQSKSQTIVGDENANKLEKLHVHQVYEKIAEHFSETRHKPWPQVMDFLHTYAQSGDVLVDVGCGNGKYLGHRADLVQIGLDYSRNLLTFVAAKKCEAIRSDALTLPLRDEVADVCISIAVIHHLSTLERRVKAVQEMHRILKRGGHCLIYAWAKNQNADSKPSTYLTAGGHVGEDRQPSVEITTDASIRLPVHENRTAFKHCDLLVPWKSKDKAGSTYHRFYHVFEEDELKELIESALENVKIKRLYYDQGNWCCIFQKIY